MIVVTCNCKVMSRELISDAIGRNEFDLIKSYPGGALHLHSREKVTIEHRETRRQLARYLLDTDDASRIMVSFAIHANCPYMYNRREYPWMPTGELAQLRGLSRLLDDCEQTVMNHVLNGELEVQRLLYVNDVETGIFWKDFTHLDDTKTMEV